MNGARGEVSLMVAGTPRRLCLTLGALAEIETALGCRSMADLQARLRVLSAADLMIVLAALLRGGGEAECAQQLASLDVSAGDAARAVGEAFLKALQS